MPPHDQRAHGLPQDLNSDQMMTVLWSQPRLRFGNWSRFEGTGKNVRALTFSLMWSRAFRASEAGTS